MMLCRAFNKDDIVTYYPYLIAGQHSVLVPAEEPEKPAASVYHKGGDSPVGNIQFNIVYEAKPLTRYYIHDLFSAYLIKAYLQVIAPSYIIYVYQRRKKNSSGVYFFPPDVNA